MKAPSGFVRVPVCDVDDGEPCDFCGEPMEGDALGWWHPDGTWCCSVRCARDLVEHRAERAASKLTERKNGEASSSGQALLFQPKPVPSAAGGGADEDGQTLMWDI